MADAKKLTPRIAAQNLRRSYHGQPVVNDANLSLAPGAVLAITGRSGCGKSTLLRILSALEEADDGDAFLDGQQYLQLGKSLFEPWEIRQNIVMVFQEYHLFPNLTALRNITLALEKTKKISRDQANQIAEATAKKLHIGNILSQYPQSLSGGQAQRLALTRALVLRPKVLLLDEVTSALDPATIIDVVGAIREMREMEETKEMAIILVTHFMKFAAEFADEVAFMHNGKIHEILPAKEFVKCAKFPETQEFITAHTLPL